EDGIRGFHVTGVQTCALPIYRLTSPEGMSLAMVAQADALGELLGFLWEEYELDRDGTWQLVGQDFIEDPEEAVAFAQHWVALTRSEERRVGKLCNSRGTPRRS